MFFVLFLFFFVFVLFFFGGGKAGVRSSVDIGFSRLINESLNFLFN